MAKLHLISCSVMFLCVAILSLVVAGAVAADYYESVCRVNRPGGGRGTGWAFSADNSVCHVMTNRHVVGKSTSVELEFWQKGHKSSRIPARVIWRSSGRGRDLAVGQVNIDQFPHGLEPSVIPLAPRGSDPQRGDTIMTVGCPRASWAKASRGHVSGYKGGHYTLVPPVVPGQSGSPILNGDGTQALGVVTWHSPSRAQSLETVYSTLFGAQQNRSQYSPIPIRPVGLNLKKLFDFGNCDPDKQYNDPEEQSPSPDTPYPGLVPALVPEPPTPTPNPTPPRIHLGHEIRHTHSDYESRISALENRVDDLESGSVSRSDFDRLEDRFTKAIKTQLSSPVIDYEEITQRFLAALQAEPLFHQVLFDPITKREIDSEPVFLRGEMGQWYRPASKPPSQSLEESK